MTETVPKPGPDVTAPGFSLGDARTPSDARFEGDRLYLRGEFAAARAVFERLVQASHEVNWCLFQLGRIAAQQGRWAEAVDRFDAALLCDDPITWAHLERATALKQLGAEPRAVAAALVSFVQRPPDELVDGHYAVLLEGAHRAYEAKVYDEARILYEFVAASGQGGYLCKLRCADLRLLGGDAEAALRMLEQLAVDPQYEFWGEVTKARALLDLRRYAAAAGTLKSLVAAAPENLNLIRLLFTALEGNKEYATLASPEQFLSGLPNDLKFEFLLCAKLARQDYHGVAALYSQYPSSVTSAGEAKISSTIYQLIESRDFAAVDRLVAGIGPIAAQQPGVIRAALSACFTEKNWVKAERILESASGFLGPAGNPELRLQKLQFLCWTLQLDKAKTLLTEWGTSTELPEAALALAADLYAALGDWDAVLTLFYDRIRRGLRIDNDFLLEAVVRATRRTRRYGDALKNVCSAIETSPAANLVDLRDRLLAELSLLRSLDDHFDGQEPGRGGAAGPPISAPLYARRTDLLLRALRPVRKSKIRRSIYLCTDANYLIGACVAVFSLLRNNLGSARQYSLTVVCSDDAMAFAAPAFRDIAAAFALPIRLIPSTELLENAHRLRTDYGFFTSGHRLSEAAYYRVFMAQRLQREQSDGCALYIDSDTCIGPGMDELFDFDLEGFALGARVEKSQPEIRHAAIALGVDPERYFNSGVLLFDLSHPALPQALARTIDIATQKSDLLFFQDQCALNLAFQGQTAMLPAAFNSFVRENDDVQTISEEPVVWHFLDRPKPWDPMYRGPNCMRWIAEFAALGQVLSPELLKSLLSVQFIRAQQDVSTPAGNTQIDAQ